MASTKTHEPTEAELAAIEARKAEVRAEMLERTTPKPGGGRRYEKTRRYRFNIRSAEAREADDRQATHDLQEASVRAIRDYRRATGRTVREEEETTTMTAKAAANGALAAVPAADEAAPNGRCFKCDKPYPLTRRRCYHCFPSTPKDYNRGEPEPVTGPTPEAARTKPAEPAPPLRLPDSPGRIDLRDVKPAVKRKPGRPAKPKPAVLPVQVALDPGAPVLLREIKALRQMSRVLERIALDGDSRVRVLEALLGMARREGGGSR